jgi:hypothetical protein
MILLHNVACSVKHSTSYQHCTESKKLLLSDYSLNYSYCELFREWNMGWDGHYVYYLYIYIYIYTHIIHTYICMGLSVCIWNSVAVCAVYVVTEHEGNMNMGQYYSQ